MCRGLGAMTSWYVDSGMCRRLGTMLSWYMDSGMCRGLGAMASRYVDSDMCRGFGAMAVRCSRIPQDVDYLWIQPADPCGPPNDTYTRIPGQGSIHESWVLSLGSRPWFTWSSLAGRLTP